MTDQIRQGDVLLATAQALPLESKLVPSVQGRLVLARGEATGHAHAVSAACARLYQATNGDLFLEVTTPALLEHEEHAAIALAVGYYRVVRQREYTPEQHRLVRD